MDPISPIPNEGDHSTSVPSMRALKDVIEFNRFDDVYIDYRGARVMSCVQKENMFLFHCDNGVALKIEMRSPEIVRFKYSFTGRWEDDFSYAIDPSHQLSDFSHEPSFGESQDVHFIETSLLRIEIIKENAQVNIFNQAGVLICGEEIENGGYYARTTLMQGTTEVRITKASQPNERFYGLGDKSGPLNLKGQKLENWNTDAYAFGTQTDPLYKSIPVYYGLHNDMAYGIFLDSPYRSTFDFDATDKGQVTFSANGGEINYYFIYGPELNSVATRYAQLTGVPELPPLWALGFHQCRWSYFPEQRVMELAKSFRDHQIPCDAIYLDIDYMDDYRCFTWDQKHFPTPKQLIAELRAQGFQTVVMIDPGIKEDTDYFVYKEGLEKGYFCKHFDGEVYVGQVWPGATVFPDYTNPAVRTWWGNLYRCLYLEDGVSGFWNDMNEPANFKVNHKTIPDTVRHHYEGRPASHKKAHNIYGMQMTRASMEGFKRLNPKKRPFLLNRATFSGGQRYSAVWTGDNVASWEHLQMANRQVQRLSISGFSFAGSDIGGFSDMPSGELMVRWLQLGAFHLFYRIHSMGNNAVGDGLGPSGEALETADRMDQEPWSFGEPYTSAARKAIELRYRLTPYIYTAFHHHTRAGTPVITTLSFYDQTDPNLLDSERDFLSGDHLLICPVIEPDATTQSIYLPKGEWYDYHTGTHYMGKQSIKTTVDLDTIPIFVMAGAAIPHHPVMQYVGQQPIEILRLDVYYSKGRLESTLYEDAGEGYEYGESEAGAKQTMFITDGGQVKHFNIQRSVLKGTYLAGYHSFLVRVVGLPFVVSECIVDGRNVLFAEKEGVLEVVVEKDWDELDIMAKEMDIKEPVILSLLTLVPNIY